MNNILVIGLGGFVGAILRYLVGVAIHQVTRGFSHPIAHQFPWGTLVVNVAGCFLFGRLSSITTIKQMISPQWNSLVFVGFLGAFTTFSTFSKETQNLVDEGKNMVGWSYLAISLVAGIGALMLGAFWAQRYEINLYFSVPTIT